LEAIEQLSDEIKSGEGEAGLLNNLQAMHRVHRQKMHKLDATPVKRFLGRDAEKV